MKTKSIYICSECGAESPRWQGKCSECDSWNTLEETVVALKAKQASATPSAAGLKSLTLNEISTTDEVRFRTGLSEFDRVLGGGIVKGSVVLLSGDPGIGKSTLILQVCEYLKTRKILYVSGEESAKQLKLRAERLSVFTDNLFILTETNVGNILLNVENINPDILIIDSIQTMNLSEISSAAGSITQVRECTNAFMRLSKQQDISTIIVGHVNKDGAIAGPKVLEHIVDAVLYFEGERNLTYRILRAVKNRFGSTNEIGVFEMVESGLQQVENPSLMLLGGRPKNVSGTCVACIMEGSRPILAEVQGLASQTGFGNPRRTANGFDYNRLNLLLAVLEKRAGFFFGALDVYVNIPGGLRLDEPAADLTVAIALISSLKDAVVPEDVICFGELGLAGEVRAVTHASARVAEAHRLGFKKCIVPIHNMKTIDDKLKEQIKIVGVRTIRQAFESIDN